MISKILKPGDKLEISVISKERDEKGEPIKKTYTSELYEIVDDNKIHAAMPMEQMKVVLLPVGAEYNLCFYTSNGLYQCMGRVSERFKNNNLFVLSFEFTTGLKRYQRREYYRLNCSLEMKSKAIEDYGKDENDRLIFMDTDLTFDDGVMVDISGGGARFISGASYEKGSLIRYNFSLFVSGELNEYNLVGKVINSRPLENRAGKYESRIQFIEIVQDERESIIKYIFEEERRIRHRERG